MARNIEIKLPCADLSSIRSRALASGATDAGLLEQTDTFFRVSSGRLKLRESNGSHSELIAYARPDLATAKASDYLLVLVPDAAPMLAALSAACGVSGIVRKRRELLIWRNVRIHLDLVEGLGTFVELESVVGDVEEAQAAQNLQTLLQILGLRASDAIAEAYAELLATKCDVSSQEPERHQAI